MELKHTPGPWRTSHHGDWVVGRDDKSGSVVVAKGAFNWKANSRLIAAAPDLLEALSEMVEIAEAQGLRVTRARAAISKAMREQA